MATKIEVQREKGILLMPHFFAFTLAEVLITLGIIGIVAALTIPVIMGNAEKQKIVSQVKEAYSILSQATTQINNDCGGDIMGCLSTPNAAVNNSTARLDVANLYIPKLSLAKDCSDASTGCFANKMYNYLDNTNFVNMDTNGNYTNILLKNGFSVAFQWLGQTYAPPQYFWVYVDVNGAKPPNQVGKDVFRFNYDINQKCIKRPPDNDCSTSNQGFGCATKLLNEDAINYY